MMMGIAVTLGLVFLQADDDFVGVQYKCVICCMLLVRLLSHSDHFIFRIGAIFFAIINVAFLNIQAVDMLQKEKPVSFVQCEQWNLYTCTLAATCVKGHLSNITIIKFSWQDIHLSKAATCLLRPTHFGPKLPGSTVVYRCTHYMFGVCKYIHTYI